jgi:heme/copper-type cytochrome/quinol oxidase subunit 2
MSRRTKTILIHVVSWILFLSVPIFIYTGKNPLWEGDNATYFLIRVSLASMLFITNFYLNYYYLIPKFLFPKKYFQYVFLLVACWFLSGIVPTFIFKYTMHKGAVTINPAIQPNQPLGILLFLLMFTVVLIASIALRVNSRWKQTEKERLTAQLAYLKTQINPHFLFNILNNIYSATIDKAPQAADMIDRLSLMMRYTLKETQGDFVPLDNEIEYITNYIELQRVRFDSSVKFHFTTSGVFHDKQIAPLILIPFIENAFKHGINSEQDSSIIIIVEVEKYELHLRVFNNKVEKEINIDDRSGLGIDNTKHRLSLIYPNKHLLSIENNKKTFNVSLHINLL